MSLIRQVSVLACLLAAPILALPTAAFAWEGDIYIDCHDFSVAKTSSPDKLKITVKEGTTVLTETSVNLQSKYPNAIDPGTCPIGGTIIGTNGGLLAKLASFSATKRDVTVTFTATGSNAIWIDRIVVDSSAAILDSTRGVDGAKGWCLSTNSDDSFGSDRQDGKCAKSEVFVFTNKQIAL